MLNELDTGSSFFNPITYIASLQLTESKDSALERSKRLRAMSQELRQQANLLRADSQNMRCQNG